MKQTRKLLLLSALSVVLCVAMLVGTTFAWFTDSVTSGNNRIVAGNLDIELFYKTPGTNGGWVDVEDVPVGDDPMFFVDANGGPILWEPGAVSVASFKVVNAGSLALKYALQMRDAGHNSLTVEGIARDLTEVLKVAVLDGEQTLTREQAIAATVGELESFDSFADIGALEAVEEKAFTVVVYWEPTANDDNYNANNGRQALESDSGPSVPNQLYVNIDIALYATQETSEADSFDSLYDIDAAVAGIDIPVIVNFTRTATGITIDAENNIVTAEPVLIANSGGTVKVSVPSGVKTTNDEGNDGTLTLTVTEKDPTTVTSLGVVVANNDSALVSYDIEVNEVDDARNSAPITVEMFVGKNLIANAVWHNGTQMTEDTDDNLTLGEYTYNPETGVVKFVTSSFSTFTMDFCNIVIDKGVVLGLINPEATPDIVVPATANGYNVTEIGESAFYFDNNRFTTSVILPEGLLKIAPKAFKKAYALTTVNLPSTLTEIGYDAFQQCNLTCDITIPAGVKVLSEDAFYENKNLENVFLTEGLEIIEKNALRALKIKQIEIPSTVKNIGQFAFRDCKSLEGITFACDTVDEIPELYGSDCFKRMASPNVKCYIYLQTQDVFDYFASNNLIELTPRGTNMEYALAP